MPFLGAGLARDGQARRGAIRLPATVDAGKVTAAFKDGALTVTMPKAADAKGTTIPVKAA